MHLGITRIVAAKCDVSESTARTYVHTMTSILIAAERVKRTGRTLELQCQLSPVRSIMTAPAQGLHSANASSGVPDVYCASSSAVRITGMQS